MAVRHTEEVMGMPVTVVIQDAGDFAPSLRQVFAELRRVDRLFSPFLPFSQVSLMNRGRLAHADADRDLKLVLDLCRLYQTRTRGYFSAYPQGRLDPSGLVKGWAIDRAAQILIDGGARNFFVDGAGDVLLRGRQSAARPWLVGIRHPQEHERTVRVLEATDLAVATSGTYEKGLHVVDPHTGRASEHWVSVTVVGPDMVEADVLATAALAMGPGGLDLIEHWPGYDGYAIDRNQRAYWTSDFERHCRLERAS